MIQHRIDVNFCNYNSIDRAVDKFLRFLKNIDLLSDDIHKIEFSDMNNQILSPSVLTNKKLLNEIMALTPKVRSELIFALKLIELDMEDQVTDIGWEIQKLAKRLKDPTRLLVEEGIFFGADILFAIGRTWSSWAYMMGKYIQQDWDYEKVKLPFTMMENILLKEKWNEGMIRMFINCQSSTGRKLLASHDLRYYLGLKDKLEKFKKALGSELKDRATAEIIEDYYKDADINYRVKDIQEVLNIKKDTGRNKAKLIDAKGYVIEKNISEEVIELKYMLALSEETSVLVKVDHPRNRDGQTLTKWRFSGKDGAINRLKWIPDSEGVYVFTIIVKGKPIIKERLVYEYPKENQSNKKDESYTSIINYGVYGFNHDHKEGYNISLTSQKLERKAALGSYFGITYNLNQCLCQDKEKINVGCHVKSSDEHGDIIIDESWDDIAYSHQSNNFAYKIEDPCELREGPWMFTLTYEGKNILQHTFKIRI